MRPLSQLNTRLSCQDKGIVIDYIEAGNVYALPIDCIHLMTGVWYLVEVFSFNGSTVSVARTAPYLSARRDELIRLTHWTDRCRYEPARLDQPWAN